MTVKLWELSDALADIGERIKSAGGEVSEDTERALEALEGEFNDKVERVALYIRSCELTADAAKEEADRLTAICKANESAATGLREYLRRHMERQGVTKVETHRARIGVQRNSQPVVELVADEMPDEFVVHVPKLDKRAVLRAWEQSHENPVNRTAPDGFRIYFGSHLKIR